MAEPIAEYTVSDFSAVDKQIEEISKREKSFTNQMHIRNLRRLVILGGAILLVLGLFLILAAFAYRVAFPPEQIIPKEPIPMNIKVTNDPLPIEITVNGNTIEKSTGSNNPPDNEIIKNKFPNQSDNIETEIKKLEQKITNLESLSIY